MRLDIKTLNTSVLAAAISAALGMGLWFCLINLPFFIFVFILGFFISLPILVAAFGYGIRVGIFSAVLAMFFLLASLPPAAALLITLFFFVPSVFAGWLTGLAQAGKQKNQIVWYPLSPALFQLALVIAIATITIMLYLHSSAEMVQHIDSLIDQFMAAVSESNFYSAADQAIIEKTVHAQFIFVIASVIPVYGFLFHLGNLYFSMRLAEKLGCLKRPLDDWPTALRMPLTAFVIFTAGWTLSLFALDNTLAICINVIVSVLGAGFLVSGLAFIHQTTRGHAWRIALLCTIYIGLFTLVLTPFIVIMLIMTGLFATFFSAHRNGKTKPPHKNHLN